MRKLLALCSIALLCLFPAVSCLAEGSKDMFPAGALGNRSYLTSSPTSTSPSIGNMYNPGRMFVYAKAGEVLYIGNSAQGVGQGSTRLVAPNGTVYSTGAGTTIGRINNRAEELAGPAALTAGGYNAYTRTVLTGEDGIWTVEFGSPNPSAALGTGTSPPAANSAWTIALQTGLSTTPQVVAWDITVASGGVAKTGRTYLTIFTGYTPPSSSQFYGKFTILTKDGFIYTAASNGIQPILFAFFVNNKGTRDRATGVPVYKSVILTQATNVTGPYSFHNPTTPDDATNVTQKMFYNTPDNTLPSTAPIWISGAANTWLISTPVSPAVSNVYFTGLEGTPGQSGTPPLAGGYVYFTANENGNFRISIDVNNNGNTTDPVDRIITGSSVTGENKILWDGKNGLGTDVSNNTNINISVILYSGEVHFPYLDVENNINGIIITRINGSNAPDPTVYWNDELLGSTAGASSPVNASASPGINSNTNGHRYTNSYGDNSLLDTWAYIFSAPLTTSLKVRQLQADLEVVNNQPGVGAICVGSKISFVTTVRNNGPDTATGAKFSFSFPAALTGVTVTPTITGTAAIVSGGVIGNAYTATVNMNNGSVISYLITGTVSAVPAGGNLTTKSSILRPPDVTDPDATNADGAAPTDPDVECNGAPSGAGCNNIKTSTVPVSPTIGSNIITAAQSVCLGSPTAPLTGTTIAGSPVYLWQRSITSATAGFATVSGVSNGRDYTPPALVENTWYRRVVTGGSCADTSTAIMVTINPVLTPGAIAGSQVFCGSGNPVAFSESITASGGAGSYAYRWQSAVDSITFTDISGAVQPTYDAPLLTQSTWFRRIVSSTGSGCADMITDTVVVRIDALPTTANAGPAQQLCNVNAATLAGNTPVSGTGLWSQVAGPAGLTFVNAVLPNTGIRNLSPGNYILVWTITNGSCTPSADTVQIQVYAQPDAARAGPDQTKYNNGNFTMSANAPVNGDGAWTIISGSAVIADTTNPNTNVTLQPNTSATLVWSISNGNCAVATDTVVLKYIRQADLKITKTDAGNTYKTGSPLNYTLSIENLGPSNVSGFQLQELLPAKMSNVAWTATVNGAGVNLRPASGTGAPINPTGDIPFAAGNKIVITVTGNVATTAIGGDTIKNIASVIAPADMPDPVAANNTATVTGIVPNNPPTAVTDNYTTRRDVPVSGNVLTNDSDPENQPITVTPALIQQPGFGTVKQNADGTFTYSPQPGFVGRDTYKYQVCDNQGACAVGTVNITVLSGLTDLRITKTATPANAVAGSPLTYTITLVNNGPSTIFPQETFNVTDSLPDGFTPGSFTPSEGSYTSNTGAWTGALLTPGKPVTLTINGQVNTSYAGASLVNTVSAVPPAATTDSTPAIATVVTPVTRTVEIKVTKTDNTSTYTAGTNTKYNLSIFNNGPSDLMGATFQDLLPTGITIASWTANTPQGGQAKDSGTGAINEPINLPAKSRIDYVFTIAVPSGYTGPLTNTAGIIVPSGYNNVNPAGNSATDTDTPNSKTDVDITKTGPASGVAGGAISYQLIIVNNGPSDVSGVTIADQLPAQIVSPVWTVTTNGKATASTTTGSGAVNFTAGLPAGAGNTVTVKISGTVATSATGSLSNTATATAPGATAIPSNTVNTTLINTSGLTLIKQGPATGHVAAGSPISYTLELTNAGPSDAEGIVLTDLVPSAITGVNWSLTPSGTAAVATGSPSTGSGNNVATKVNIPAGAGNGIAVQINGTVASNAADTLVNTATAALPGTTVAAMNKTVVDNIPGLQIVKAGPLTVNAGTAITYTITVTNNGPSDAMQAAISDVIAQTTVSNVSWTATTSGNAVINSGATGNGSTLLVNANIPAGNNNAITILVQGTVNAGAAGNIDNTASITLNGQQPLYSNGVITKIINKPTLLLTKSGPATIEAGGTIDYLLQINNSGPSDAQKAVLYDTLPVPVQQPMLKIVTKGRASYFNADISDNVLSFIGNIPAGDSNAVLIYITGKVDPAFSGQITNQAQISTSDGTIVHAVPVVTTVANNPRLTLSKSAPDTAVAGQTVTYTLSVSNTGLSDATNAVITDVVPAGLTNVQWTTATQGTATVVTGATGSGNTVNVTGNVPAGVNQHIIITITGKLSAAASGVLQNYFTSVTGGNTATSDTTQTYIVKKPVLQITKTGTQTVTAGGSIVYTLEVRNTGLSDAVDVNIVDSVNAIIQNARWTSSVAGGAAVTAGSTGNANLVAVMATIPANSGVVTILINGTVSPSAAGTLMNTATASVVGTPTVKASVSSLITNDPTISISKTGPAQIKAGEQLSYQLVITNYGISDARDIVIQDIVPASLTDVKWTTSLSGIGTIISGATGTGNNVVLNADLNAGTGNRILVNITGIVPADYIGILTNYAGVFVSGKDTVRSDSIKTTVINTPGIQVVKSAPDSIPAGSDMTFTVTVTNIGPSDAPQITITDVVPAGLQQVSWTAVTAGAATVATGAGSGSNVNLNGAIAAGNGNSITLTIHGKVDPAFTGAMSNTATVTPAGNPPVVSNKTTTQVTKKNTLLISKSAPAKDQAGSKISYLITLTNAGPSDATGVQMRDTVPAGIKNVSWTTTKVGTATVTNGATGTGNQVVVAADVSAGSGVVITVNGTIDPAYTGASISNIAYAATPDQPLPVRDTAITTVSSLARIVLTKTAPGSAFSGDTITYTIHLSNVGPSDAHNINVTDVIDPAILQPVWTAVTTGSGTTISSNSGAGNIQLTADIPAAAGHAVDITVTGKLDPAYTGSNVSNTVTADIPGQVPFTSAVNTTVSRKAQLRVVKSGPANSISGEKITYTITVTNEGPSYVSGATIADILPTEILKATWTAVANGAGSFVSAGSGTGDVNLQANIPAGTGSIDIIVNGTIDPAVVSGGNITNTVTVTPPADMTNTNPATDFVTTHVTKEADLAIVKTGPANIAAGQEITYQLLATNNGISNVNTVTTTDVVPAFIHISNVTALANGTATAGTPVVTGNTVTLNSSIAAGSGNSVLLTITGTVDPAATGAIVNTATVAVPANVKETNPANNVSSITTNITTDLGVQVSKSGPASVNINDQMTYTIVLSNNGLSDANEVFVTDNIPPEVTGAVWTAVVAGNASIDVPAGSGSINNIKCSLGGSNSGTVTITITGKVSPGAGNDIINTVTAVAANTKTSQVVTSVNHSADLRINKTAPAAMPAGKEITYVITVNNAGPADVTGAVVNDNVPAGVTNVSWTATGTNGATALPANGNGNTIAVTGDIPAGSGIVTITVKGIVNPGFNGPLTNTATATPPAGVTDPTPNTVTVTTQITPVPGLSILKSGPAQIAGGDTVRYALEVRNNGPSAATGVSIRDSIPAALTNVTWTATTTNATIANPGTGIGAIVDMTGDIPVGGLIRVMIKGTSDPAFTGHIMNRAVVAGNGQSVLSNEVNTQVINSPGLAIRKSGPAKIAAGGQLTYAIEVTNTGLSTASGITVSDVLPAALKNAVWSAVASGGAAITGGDISNRSGNVTFQATIPPGSTPAILVTVNATADPSASGSVMNVATVTPATGTALTDTATTLLTTMTGIRVVKAAPDTAAAGNVISYSIDVYNDGPSDAVGVLVTDVLSATLQNVRWSAVATGNAAINGGNLPQQTGNVNFTGNIPAGSPNVIRVIITASIPAAQTAALNNQANARLGGVDYPSNSVITQVSNRPGIHLTKSGPPAAAAGSNISYNLVLTNDGPSDATNISVTDLLPAQLQTPVWSAVAQGTAVITGGNVTGRPGNVSLMANVPAGASNRVVITVSGSIPASFSGNISNTATYTQNTVTVNTPPVITVVDKRSAVRINKSGPDSLIAGSSINYTLLVANDGPSDADSITITDLVPASVQNVKWTAAGTGATLIGAASGTGNTVSVQGSIPAGGGNNILVTITGTVAPGLSGVIENKAAVSIHGNVMAGDAVTTKIVNKPGVQFTKSGPPKAIAGSSINYVIALSNQGPSDLTNAVVTDIVPAQITQVTWSIAVKGNATLAAGTPVSGSGNQVSFNAGVPAGAGNEVLVTINGRIDPDYEGNITNTATAMDSIGTTYTSTTNMTVSRQALVKLDKIGPAAVKAGSGISYVITASNQGPSDANGIVIADLVPATIANVSWSAVASGVAKINGIAAGTGNSIQLQGDLAAGNGNTIQITVSGQIDAAVTATAVSNTATLKKADGSSITSPTVTTTIQNTTGIHIVKVAPPVVSAGDSLQYVITVENTGPSDAHHVQISDVVPAALSNVSWTATTAGNAQIIGATAGTGSSVNVKADIAAGNGNSIQLRIIGKVSDNATGSITNIASAIDGNSQIVSSNQVSTMVNQSVKSLDLSITKLGPAQVTSNDSITYIIVAQNAGPAAGDGAVITDILPADIEGVYARALVVSGGTGGVQISNAGNVVKVTIGTFPAGAALTIAITGKVNGAGQLRNQAVIAAADGVMDTDIRNNTSATVITGVAALPVSDLRLQKELLTTAPMKVGSKAEFALTLSNAGPFTATSVVVRDSLKNNLEIVNGFDASVGVITYDPATRILVWSLDSLALTQTATLKYTTRITNTGDVINSATVRSALPDPVPGNNVAASQVVTVTGDDIFIPNIISPNGDGKNDKFIVPGISRYPNSTLFIYNRWGNMVYQSKNYQNEWTGDALNEGTYYYILKLNTPAGERSYKGWIELVR